MRLLGLATATWEPPSPALSARVKPSHTITLRHGATAGQCSASERSTLSMRLVDGCDGAGDLLQEGREASVSFRGSVGGLDGPISGEQEGWRFEALTPHVVNTTLTTCASTPSPAAASQKSSPSAPPLPSVSSS